MTQEIFCLSHIFTLIHVGLKYPEYRGKDLVPTDECLFTDKELFRMTDFSV